MSMSILDSRSYLEKIKEIEKELDKEKETYGIADIMRAMREMKAPMKAEGPPEPEKVPFFMADTIRNFEDEPYIVQLPVDKLTELLEHIKGLEQRVSFAEKRLSEVENPWFSKEVIPEVYDWKTDKHNHSPTLVTPWVATMEELEKLKKH